MKKLLFVIGSFKLDLLQYHQQKLSNSIRRNIDAKGGVSNE